jgi:pimeloyl-ACP methyl ester carboxylesterase
LNAYGTTRQLAAVLADGDRTHMLAHIKAPTCVIHGRSDPLIRVSEGVALSKLIQGATADLIEGMGHDLPAELLSHFADSIRVNADRAKCVV